MFSFNQTNLQQYYGLKYINLQPAVYHNVLKYFKAGYRLPNKSDASQPTGYMVMGPYLN